MSQPPQSQNQWLQGLAAKSQPQWGWSRQAGKADPLAAYMKYVQQHYSTYLQPMSWGSTISHHTVDWGDGTTTTTLEAGNVAGESDFSGFDLAIGEVYGVRHWRMDDFGRLSPVAWDAQAFWRPGVNTAVCARGYETTSWKERQAVDPSGQGRTVVKAEEETGDVPVNLTGFDGITNTEGNPYHIVQRKVVRTHVEWSDGSHEEIEGKLAYEQVTKSRPHAVPDEGCGCGFYAYSDREHDQYRSAVYVGGIIKGYGRTLIGPKGFRCEKAEIVALIDPTRGGERSSWERKRRLELLHRIYPDVPMLGSWEAALAAYPVEDSTKDAQPDPSTEDFWQR